MSTRNRLCGLGAAALWTFLQSRRNLSWHEHGNAAGNRDKAAEAGKEKHKPFTKMDLTAIILDQGLSTKAEVMSYTQEHGTAAMQAFVHHQQRKLKEHIEDAMEWASARESAARERESDWSLIQRLSKEPCSCNDGGGCPWHDAARAFFARNADSIDEGQFAHCVARIICEGPNKVVRVPLLVGPSNSAKSTILDPIDLVFGPENVQHKPDLGSSMPLANITKQNKRFMYLDEFQCVEYASMPVKKPTIPVTTLLKMLGGQYFEVQVSQSFHDGNVDCRWTRGIAITSKLQGLWEPRGPVSAEDVKHLQNRVEQFTAVAHLPRQELRTIVPCRSSFCKWLAQASAAFAGRVVPQTPAASSAASDRGAVAGFWDLMRAASIPPEPAENLHAAVLGAGAVHVQELLLDDWPCLPCWGLLLPLQQRRLLAAVSRRACAF